MKLIRFAFMALMILVMCAGCAKTHMIDVPDHQQEVERTLYQQEAIIDGIAAERIVLYQKVAKAAKFGQITPEDFAAYKMVDSVKIRPAIIAAHEACKEYKKEILKGNLPDAGYMKAKVAFLQELINKVRKAL